MTNRAYSFLTIKTVDDEQRIITGVATTPEVDRVGDVIEPLGVKFRNPMPLLHQHRSSEPVGTVKFDKPTADGITFTARLPTIAEPGPLRDRIETAWGEVKAGLVRAVSIGFRVLDGGYELMDEGGIRFTKTEVLELSLVTIPANSGATIQTIKSIDAQLRAASGNAQAGEPVPTQPHRAGPVKLHSPKPRGGAMKTIAERIAEFEATRAAKAARMEAIQNEATEAGQTKDAAQREEFNTLRDEIKSIDAELLDLREMETLNLQKATPVAGNGTKAAAASRGGEHGEHGVVRAEPKLAPGIEFARFAMCVFRGKGDMQRALKLMETHYPQQKRAIAVTKAAVTRGSSIEELLMQQKAAVLGGTTTETTWAEPLLAYNVFAGDFLEFLRPRTIIGQFGLNGIPELRPIGFNMNVKGQTSGGTGYWVGEGRPKPVTRFDFSNTYHGFTKVAALAVLTDELVRFSDPSAERLVRDALASCLIARIDTDFVDPDKAVDAGISPASITNGVTAIGSSGDDADAVRTDIMALWEEADAADMPLEGAVYIMRPRTALALSLLMTINGTREFPEITQRGGSLLGVPVIVSNYVPGGVVILAFASEIYLSDDGAVTVDFSREASIQMDDAPTNRSDTGVGASLVSMFQTNSVALRAERFINWSKRRATAVAMLEGVEWGGATY